MIKKYLVTLGCVCFSQAFSFNKMSDLILHKRSRPQMGSVQYTQISVPNDFTYAQLSDNLKPGEFYFGYIYDEDFCYGLNKMIWNKSSDSDITFNLLKRQKFNKEWWDNFIKEKPDVKINKFHISEKDKESINLEIEKKEKTSTINQLNNFIQSNQAPFAAPLGTISQQSIDINKNSYDFKISKINVNLNNYKVEISNEKGKTIDFQKALITYVEKGCDPIKSLQLVQKLELEKEFCAENTTTVIDLMNKSKEFYTEAQLELLKTSKILAIWCLPLSMNINKEYVEEWNKQHSNELPKQIKSMLKNNIILGFAVDKNNETFNWVIDLGQNIEVLFEN